jgi:hypothetical protein
MHKGSVIKIAAIRENASQGRPRGQFMGEKITGRTSTARGRRRIHLGLIIAECICIPAFIFETERALHGNTLSWAYVIEWPVLAGYAVYMWAKMLREERGQDARSKRTLRQIDTVALEEQDPQLKAWNDYLASVHNKDTNQTADETVED